jgi:peptidoglycan/LPS O-acetylase OafA/YrhL
MAIAFAVVRIARSPALKRAAFRSGDYSYGLYVYAFPVQQLVIASLAGRATPYAVFLITAASVLPIAALSWHGVEKRALKLVRNARVDWRPFTRKATPAGLAVKD